MNIQEIIGQVLEHLRSAWRFRRFALLVAVGVCLVGWTLVLRLPDRYQAGARVFVDTQTLLSQVTRGLTLEADVNTQINRVSQMMLSGPQLQVVAEETGLIAQDAPPEVIEGRVVELREQIAIDGYGTGGSGSIYVISYQNPDRDLALRVVENLLDVFVEGTLGGKRSSSEEAQDFLVEQIADHERRLEEAEKRRAEFQKKYVGLMPGSQGDYFTRLQNEMTAMKRVEGELNQAMQERATLQRQLNGQQPYIESGAVAAALVNSPTMQRLREAQSKLDELLLRYTEKNPEVEGLREVIQELEKRHAAEIAAAQGGDSGAASSAGLAASPVYQQIQLNFNQNEVRIATLQAQLDGHRAEVKRLQGLVDTAPGVEAEYAQLNRDYELVRDAHQSLLHRREQTRLGEEVEQKGAVQFEVIDPPNASFNPVAPKRPPLIAAVLVLALGAGGGLAFGLHLIKPVFSTPAALQEATGLPVIGVVPRTWLDRHRSAFRRNVLQYAGAVSCLVLLAVVVVIQESQLTRLVQQVLQ